MLGLMMNAQLSIPGTLRRTQLLFGNKPIVSRRPDRLLHRTTYAECLHRAGQLGRALRRLGVRPGDRVATLAWNHHRHLEAYYAIPSIGAVLHTLNLRLHPDDIVFIAKHAGDRVVLVDKVLWPLWEKCAPHLDVERVIVMTDDGEVPHGTLEYEALLAAEGPDSFEFDDVDESSAGAMCYTSGTTGQPKGVVYSHRSMVLHAIALGLVETFGLSERDVVLPVVPMFHVNAWGLPFAGAMFGFAQVHPGPHLDPASLLQLLSEERVSLTAGVPTIWLGILQTLDANPAKYDLSALRAMIVGGSAAPEAMIRAFQERHGLNVVHAWGMTETSPLGSIGHLSTEIERLDEPTRYAYRAKQGRPAPLVEIRARTEAGLAPWDGTTMGELEVRGPWIAGAYYQSEDDRSRFTDDGWFRTGDIVTIDMHGYITIQDRSKDLVKSGGEWISSVALESALMGHPDVAEAAVVAVPHVKWDERPLAIVVMKQDRVFSAEALRELLEARFAKWWIPDAIVPVLAIPKSSAGKFLKSAIREEYREYYHEAPVAAGGADRVR